MYCRRASIGTFLVAGARRTREVYVLFLVFVLWKFVHLHSARALNSPAFIICFQGSSSVESLKQELPHWIPLEHSCNPFIDYAVLNNIRIRGVP